MFKSNKQNKQKIETDVSKTRIKKSINVARHTCMKQLTRKSETVLIASIHHSTFAENLYIIQNVLSHSSSCARQLWPYVPPGMKRSR